MKKGVIGAVALCLLLLAATACASGQTRESAHIQETPGIMTEHIWVYGESALIAPASAHGDQGSLILRGRGEAGQTYEVHAALGDRVDQGLLLRHLPPGEYCLYWGELPLKAGDIYLPAGYTLPRQGGRLHWVFGADPQGLLTLSVTCAEELPEGWYDVIIDPGHGGEDRGALGFGYTEAELNLSNALCLKAYLEQWGLLVALSRYDDRIPGGVKAENDPYVRGGRVELIYASHAPYLLSCHLNAGYGRDAGFQVYGSLLASTAWSEKVAQALRQAGAVANNGGSGLVAPGVYQRPTLNTQRPRDYYFILRETGGYALSPANFLAYHRYLRQELCRGAQGLLLEFAFMDNQSDLEFWLEHYKTLLSATAEACAAYWQL